MPDACESCRDELLAAALEVSAAIANAAGLPYSLELVAEELEVLEAAAEQLRRCRSAESHHDAADELVARLRAVSGRDWRRA